MNATVWMSDGEILEMQGLDQAVALDLVESLPEQQFVTLRLGDTSVVLNVDHIVRIELD